MRQKERKTAVIFLCALAVLAAVGGFLWKGGDPSSQIRGSIQDIMTAAGKPVFHAAEGIRSGLHGIFQFKRTIQEKEQLNAQIAELRKENADLRLTRSEYEELQQLSSVFSYDIIEYGQVQAANVVASHTSRWMHHFTIDQGSRSGIKEGDPVLAGDGLVGRVTEVSRNNAKVASLLDTANKISFHVERNPETIGMLQGNGNGSLSGYLLGNESKVQAGDVLRTSGMGAYPEGLVIGSVTQVRDGNGQQRFRFEARPAVNIKNVRKVAVIL